MSSCDDVCIPIYIIHVGVYYIYNTHVETTQGGKEYIRMICARACVVQCAHTCTKDGGERKRERETALGASRVCHLTSLSHSRDGMQLCSQACRRIISWASEATLAAAATTTVTGCLLLLLLLLSHSFSSFVPRKPWKYPRARGSRCIYTQEYSCVLVYKYDVRLSKFSLFSSPHEV